MLKTRDLVAACMVLGGAVNGALAAQPATLATFQVQAPARQGQRVSAEAVVEAVRDTEVAAQVQGAVVALHVKVGDKVQAGQELLRIDARAANQNAAASAAQVQAARAQLDVAAKEYERQKQLAQKHYISQAALDRAKAQWEAAQAQVQALQAQAGAAQTQSGFYVLKAPYAGIVSEVPVVLGDMAMPGRPLVRVYDPSALRVTATVAQSAAASLAQAAAVEVDVPGAKVARLSVPAAQVQRFPALDAATHTVQLRVPLPAQVQGALPGMFARVAWQGSADAAAPAAKEAGQAAEQAVGQQFLVPASAIVRRAEMTGLYVLDAQGRPLLRQVRLGYSDGTQVEVLSGLRAGDKVATDPQAAAKMR